MPDNSNILERVKELSYSHGLTLAELERRLGFSNGSIRRWNTNRPSAERIIKTADFFDVSTNYLLGYSDDDGTLSIDELVKRLTYNDKPITDHQRQVISAIVKSYLDSDNT
ncbi:XRE family transcriptional regulator [Ligilactobacillus murinus]|uniref:helix-turn-helix domain-containing protein n=1 Tax=Ligilactobacillus murinus TaxID=1622 RepID=UPI001071A7CC|nr:helix-turn-helix transcriptional regulator [Ligilactobacillus murinus]MBF0757321.1 helix-turn-helix transcriptional regulator [Ligilactobacillus murinus]MBF0832603.1 helix-turn-helix transcriptional regulator [Ligilactobacillus murinus]TFU66687.1 XRE family transcriptional regulator [Ligilactobacillus murinus]